MAYVSMLQIQTRMRNKCIRNQNQLHCQCLVRGQHRQSGNARIQRERAKERPTVPDMAPRRAKAKPRTTRTEAKEERGRKDPKAKEEVKAQLRDVGIAAAATTEALQSAPRHIKPEAWGRQTEK